MTLPGRTTTGPALTLSNLLNLPGLQRCFAVFIISGSPSTGVLKQRRGNPRHPRQGSEESWLEGEFQLYLGGGCYGDRTGVLAIHRLENRA